MSELALLTALLVAAWSRTPVGAIGHNLLVRWRGGEPVEVLARFRLALPERLEGSLQRALAQPPPAADGLPVVDGLRPAVRAAISAHLGEDALAEVKRLVDGGRSVEAALEIRSIGADLRGRAIRRAAAAGEAEPVRFAAHRRFLPAADAAAADTAVGDVLALSTALELTWPVDPTARISSPFGYRDHPVLKQRKFHNGVDIAIAEGTPVCAAGPGTVIAARSTPVSGLHVTIDHGHAVTTSYLHASALKVDKRDTVQAGEVIMDSGSTGRVTGPHLHFILKINGRAVDPLPFRPAEES